MFDVSGDTVEPDYMARRGNMYEVLAYADEKISVPQEFFGAPWSTWLMWWVTWFPRNLLRRKLIDECDRRRWLMFSIFPQPIILVVWYALMVCWMVANTIVKLAVAAYLDGMLGMRKIDWKCVFDTDATPSDVWFDAGRSGWSSQYYTRANGEARSGWHQFVQPSSLIFVAGVFMATSTFQAQALIPFLLSLLAAIIAIPGVVVLMVRLTLGALGARFKQRSNDRWVQEQKRHQEIIAEGEQAFRLEIAALSCPLDFVPVLPLTVSALPPQKRTLSLRYQELKAKVCRPLA
jgi:hypothetical protein